MNVGMNMPNMSMSTMNMMLGGNDSKMST